MRAKEKTKVRYKLTLKKIIYTTSFILIICYVFLFYNVYFGKNESYAKEVASSPNEMVVSQAAKLDLDGILEENQKEEQRQEIVQQEVVLEYLTEYRTNPNVPKGVSYVVQEGRKGSQKITTKKVYQEEELVLEEQIGAVVTKAAFNKVVEIGGGAAERSYRVKIGDTVVVTSDRLPVLAEPTEEAQKVGTLQANESVKVSQIEDGWYYVISTQAEGWVKQECTTYRNPVSQKKEKSKEDLGASDVKTGNVGTLSFTMKLNQPSGLSLSQFQQVLKDNKDKNQVFATNAEYFYYIEKQYNINGIFVAAVGIHESAWGTSKIAMDKKNLFGYGAYDSNPYHGAYQFNHYSESIDLVARVFVKYYLNPKGTSIYGGEKALGIYYNSPTLSGVNKSYATDKNWASSVYKYMQTLYQKVK